MAKATTSRIDTDLDAQSPAADLVRVYLNGIGKTALLNAEDEVELAKRIEAGLYAAHLLETKKRLGDNRKRDLAAIVEVVQSRAGRPVSAAEVLHLLPRRFTTSVEQVKALARQSPQLEVFGPGLIRSRR